MKRFIYALLGVVILGVAGFMIYTALGSSLVYFILPSEYASDPEEYADRRLRLGGIVEPGTVVFDDERLELTFHVTDSFESYPVVHAGTPPDLFQEGFGVVVEGEFEGTTFRGDNVLVKHSEVYEPPAEGEAIDIEELKESLQ